MLGRSIGAGLLAVLSVFVFFGYSSHPRVTDADSYTPALAQLRAPVRSRLPRRFPQVAHDVFFGIKTPKKWKSIVFHHSATASGGAAAFDRYHREHLGDPNGIKYHFVIGNGSATKDGLIEITGRWRRQIEADDLFHPENAPDSIAICLVGNFEHSTPSQAQQTAAIKLAYVLQRGFHIPLSHVRTHREVDPGLTACPGRFFPIDSLRETLAVLAIPETSR